MIFVGKKIEPAPFNERVRTPGLRALREYTESVPGGFWKENDFWVRCKEDLYSKYGGICAYLGVLLHKKGSITHRSLEHFIPKSHSPQMAYEWDNYRLVSEFVNNNRDHAIAILDPFDITDDTFKVSLNTGIVKPSSNLPSGEQEKAIDTITALNINHDRLCKYRKKIYERYISKPASGAPNPDALLDEAPFVWLEAVHQGKFTI